MPDTEVRVLRSVRALEAFVPAWRRLWLADPRATPFQSPEWLVPWSRQFGGDDLRAVVMLRRSEPLCFLPLYVNEDVREQGRTMMLMGVGTSDYLDGVFAPHCSPSDVLDCLEAVLAQGGWDALEMTQLRSGSKLLDALMNATTASIHHFNAEPCSRMNAVSVAELPSKIRRNAMYYRNRARRGGPLQLSVANGENCSARFELLVQLHAARWHERGEAGVLAEERVLGWHRESVPLLLSAGILRLVALQWNKETIAVLYSLIDPPQRSARTQYFYLPAYSPTRADLRPGTLLLAEAIEHAAREGVTHIDMLRGHEAYKQLWDLEPIPTTGLQLRAPEWHTAVQGVAA